jgi:hypothetical protein
MPNNKKNPNTRMLRVEETNAALDKEFAEQDPKAKDLPPKEGESKALEESMQSSSVAAKNAGEIVPTVTAMGSDGRPLLDPKGAYFPDDSHETDENARKLLSRLSCDSEKKFQNTFLLLKDLRGLGMYGELSEDQSLVTMPFKDIHRLVTTMRMAEIIE